MHLSAANFARWSSKTYRGTKLRSMDGCDAIFAMLFTRTRKSYATITPKLTIARRRIAPKGFEHGMTSSSICRASTARSCAHNVAKYSARKRSGLTSTHVPAALPKMTAPSALTRPPSAKRRRPPNPIPVGKARLFLADCCRTNDRARPTTEIPHPISAKALRKRRVRKGGEHR